MKHYLIISMALFFFTAAFANATGTKDEKQRFTVTATSDTYLKADGTFEFKSWRQESSGSFVTIDWEGKTIEFSENGQTYEGPYYILSIGEEYLDSDRRPSVKLSVYEGFEDEGTTFVITVTEGDSIKSMSKGFLIQMFEGDVFGFELSR